MPGMLWPRRAMRVRILRVPPSRAVEGIDLRQYRLEDGRVCDLSARVARVLLFWGYAEPVADGNGRDGHR